MVMVSSTDNALLPSKLRGHDQEIMKVSSTDNALLPSKLRGHDQEIVKVSSFDTASLQKVCKFRLSPSTTPQCQSANHEVG
ncbi:hypothetical protein V6N13_101552 [Hibiscus sabdariffa]